MDLLIFFESVSLPITPSFVPHSLSPMNDDRFTNPTDDDEAADPYAVAQDDEEEDEPSVEEELALAEGGPDEKKKKVKPDPAVEEEEPADDLKLIAEAAEEIEAERDELMNEAADEEM